MKAIQLKPGDKFGLLTINRLAEGPGRRWVCDCACGGSRISDAGNLRYGTVWHCGCQRGKYWSGRTHSEETKAKISGALIGKPHPWQRKPKKPSEFQGYKYGPRPAEWRKRIAESLRGKKKTKAHRKAMKKTLLLATAAMRGKPKSESHRAKISAALKGKPKTAAHKKKMRICNRLERNPNWKGGLSYLPYPTSFNRSLKKRLKKEYDHTCQLCLQVILVGTRSLNLQIHHIDYDKANMDDANLIPLCNRCNVKVNQNRKRWTRHFQTLKESAKHNNATIYVPTGSDGMPLFKAVK